LVERILTVGVAAVKELVAPVKALLALRAAYAQLAAAALLNAVQSAALK
jgi:hypothetical protein